MMVNSERSKSIPVTRCYISRCENLACKACKDYLSEVRNTDVLHAIIFLDDNKLYFPLTQSKQTELELKVKSR